MLKLAVSKEGETNVTAKRLFMFDSTYKILRYYFLLIVLGVSDADHRFFPIAFMVTSHEETGDFDHFFSSLNELITINASSSRTILCVMEVSNRT